MEGSDYTYSLIPNDIVLKIASSLQVSDICSLSCCSRVWREIWSSDCLWEQLYKERWPLSYEDLLKNPNFKGWRGIYMKQHKEIEDQAESVLKFVEECSKTELLDLNDLLKAIDYLKPMQFGSKDVQMFLFKPKLNVLVNLVGLHYFHIILGVPASDVVEALEGCKISHREFCNNKFWIRGIWTPLHAYHRLPLGPLPLKYLVRTTLLTGLYRGPNRANFRGRISLLISRAISGPNQRSQ